MTSKKNRKKMKAHISVSAQQPNTTTELKINNIDSNTANRSNVTSSEKCCLSMPSTLISSNASGNSSPEGAISPSSLIHEQQADTSSVCILAINAEEQSVTEKPSNIDTIPISVFNCETAVDNSCCSISTIVAFVTHVSEVSITDMKAIVNTLTNGNASILIHEYGHNKLIVYIAILTNFIDGADFNDVLLTLSTYAKINQQRLHNADFFESIERNSSQILSLKSQLKLLLKEKAQSSLTCVECHKNTVSELFLPCGHVVVCSECVRVFDNVCKCCGTIVQEHHQIFF